MARLDKQPPADWKAALEGSGGAAGLDDLFNNAGIGIFQLDSAGRYALVNDCYCEMAGRSREELVSARIQDFIHPDDLATSLDAFTNVLETGGSLVVDERHIRRDGSPVWIRNNISAGRSETGAAQYIVAIAQNVTARKEAERRLSHAQGDLRVVIDTAADGLFCVDSNGRVTLCNVAFLRMLALKREDDVIGRDLHDLIRITKPDGTRYSLVDSPILRAVTHGIPAHSMSDIFFRADGTRFPVEYRINPILRDGEIQGAVCSFVDATERKRSEERIRLVNRELAHRVKNTLAIVEAIVRQTIQSSSTPDDAAESVVKRLHALARAQDSLIQSRAGNASIVHIIESAIAPHRSDVTRIRTDGPRIELETKAALALTLALHELCTNAEKYGALSNDSGEVSIQWRVLGGASDAKFELVWRESGGPAVVAPKRKGFGSRLVAELVGPDLGGEATLNFDCDGVIWTLRTPLLALKNGNSRDPL